MQRSTTWIATCASFVLIARQSQQLLVPWWDAQRNHVSDLVHTRMLLQQHRKRALLGTNDHWGNGE
jgi:hypothetical protein